MKHNKKFLNFFRDIVVLFCFSSSSCTIPCTGFKQLPVSAVCKYVKRKGEAITSSKDAKGVNMSAYQIETAGAIVCL